MIICVEDDANIRELEVYTLQNVGYEALGVSGGKELRQVLQQNLPSLILLDIMLPDEDGLTILRFLRESPLYQQVPIILATAKGSEFDKVRGLDAGADDYIAKPFGMMEMVSRVKAVLRRAKPAAVPTGMLELGGIRMDLEQHKVWSEGQEVLLTFKEFEVLRKLLLHPGRVYSREQLLNDIWGYDFTGETRTVDVHIRTLRQKLGTGGEYIETVRGVGYRLQEQK